MAAVINEPRDAECIALFDELKDMMRDMVDNSSNVGIRKLEQLTIRAFSRKNKGLQVCFICIFYGLFSFQNNSFIG